MAEYIEREALLSDFGEEPMVWTDSDSEIQERFDWYKYKGIVEEQPSADVAPVVHSKWVWTENGLADCEQYWVCDNCHDHTFVQTNCCPNCGARMDLVGKNE